MRELMTTRDLDWYKAKTKAAEYALAWQFLAAPKAVREYQRDVSALVKEVERLNDLLVKAEGEKQH